MKSGIGLNLFFKFLGALVLFGTKAEISYPTSPENVGVQGDFVQHFTPVKRAVVGGVEFHTATPNFCLMP